MFTCSHLLTFTYSRLHICSSSHLHVLTSAHLHTPSLSLSCSSPSHLHIFLPSHTNIFPSSHLLILTSSHLLIFSSSHLLSLSRVSFFFLFFLEAAGSADEASLYGHPFARSEVWVSRADDLVRFNILRGNPFAWNKVRVSKTAVFFCDLTSSAATLSHEMRFQCQNLIFLWIWLARWQPFHTKLCLSVKNWCFFWISFLAATFSREMKFEC